MIHWRTQFMSHFFNSTFLYFEFCYDWMVFSNHTETYLLINILLWTLSLITVFRHSGEKKFLPRQDSNPGPLAFKSTVLPTCCWVSCVPNDIKVRYITVATLLFAGHFLCFPWFYLNKFCIKVFKLQVQTLYNSMELTMFENLAYLYPNFLLLKMCKIYVNLYCLKVGKLISQTASKMVAGQVSCFSYHLSLLG